MEWQQILGLYHVAREKSFTKAAELTFRSQSALSQQIKSLEAEFGCLLFERTSPRKIVLTPAGELLFTFAEQAIKGLDALKDEIGSLLEKPKGNLRVAAPFTTLMRLFPDILSQYAEKYPYVNLSVLDRPQKQVIECVKKGEVDFGILLESIAPRELTAIRLKKVAFVLLVPESHPLLSEKKVSIKKIAQYPLILPQRDNTDSIKKKLYDLLDESGIEYNIILESSNVELSSIYVEKGLGISFASVIRELPLLGNRKLKFLSLEHYFRPQFLAICMKKRATLPDYKRKFIDYVLNS